MNSDKITNNLISSSYSSSPEVRREETHQVKTLADKADQLCKKIIQDSVSEMITSSPIRIRRGIFPLTEPSQSSQSINTPLRGEVSRQPVKVPKEKKVQELSESQKTEMIYKILTAARYRRGMHLPEQIKALIQIAVSKKEPLKFAGFWGVGPKAHSNWADTAACEFLTLLNNEIRAVHPPGLSFHFLFSTLHGLHNGYDRDDIYSYANEMEIILLEHGFTFSYMNDLWNKYGITEDKIHEALQAKPPGWWEAVEQKELIEKSAKRKKNTDFRYSAETYFIMRELEKGPMAQEYAGYIFHVYSDPKLKHVLPDMPSVYFYSRPGWSNTPWFEH
jgi:hypothetical protein